MADLLMFEMGQLVSSMGKVIEMLNDDIKRLNRRLDILENETIEIDKRVSQLER